MKKPAIALASSGLVVAMAWAAHASGPASQAHTAGPEGGQAMNREERRIFKAASALDTRHNLVAATEEALQP